MHFVTHWLKVFVTVRECECTKVRCLAALEEVATGCRRLHNEELHNLYASRNIITVIKSRMMTWVVHVAQMREMRSAYKILIRRPVRKISLEVPWH